MGAGPSTVIHPAPRRRNVLAVDHTSGPLRRVPTCQFTSWGVATKRDPDRHAASIKRTDKSDVGSSTVHALTERVKRSSNLASKSINTDRRLELSRCLRGTSAVTWHERKHLISKQTRSSAQVHGFVPRL